MKRSSTFHGLYHVVRLCDCMPLSVTSPHHALFLPANMSSDLAENIGGAVLAAIQSFSNASGVTATASTTEPPQHSVSLFSNSCSNVSMYIKLAIVSPVKVIFASLCS